MSRRVSSLCEVSIPTPFEYLHKRGKGTLGFLFSPKHRQGCGDGGLFRAKRRWLAFLEACSLRRLVIEMYSAKQSTRNVQHKRRETLGSERHIPAEWEVTRARRASDSIGACGARIVPLERPRRPRRCRCHRRLRLGRDTATEARKERESEGRETLKGHPKRRKLSSKAKSRRWQLRRRGRRAIGAIKAMLCSVQLEG